MLVVARGDLATGVLLSTIELIWEELGTLDLTQVSDELLVRVKNKK